MAEEIAYEGYVIYVRPAYVEIEDGTEVPGFASDIRVRDTGQDAVDGHVIWEFPFAREESSFGDVTRDGVIAKAKAFVDGTGKRP
jgi:hypothetical protein